MNGYKATHVVEIPGEKPYTAMFRDGCFYRLRDWMEDTRGDVYCAGDGRLIFNGCTFRGTVLTVEEFNRREIESDYRSYERETDEIDHGQPRF